ncbi:MAG TPA: methylmalonyl-CoA mutase family protein, partial [Planctomycetota bacterium]|nr:methylmalonyl-CoA mutase family protein [Planctomycetota bacterium]
QQEWGAALGELAARAADGRSNLMPAILRCVEAGATVGEICGRLEQVFGSYRPKAVI